MPLKFNEVERWLTGIEPRVELGGSEEAALLSLMGHPGLTALVGLMLGSRAAFYVQLAALRLTGPDAVAAASVIQGQIQGVDLLRNTLLEVATPAAADAAQEQGQ